MTKEALFEYQNDIDNYIKQAQLPFDVLALNVNKYLGGFNGKNILEIGTGFQLPHGGLNLSLSIKNGAKRCFGIDIFHPELYQSDNYKVHFGKKLMNLRV